LYIDAGADERNHKRIYDQIRKPLCPPARGRPAAIAGSEQAIGAIHFRQFKAKHADGLSKCATKYKIQHSPIHLCFLHGQLPDVGIEADDLQDSFLTVKSALTVDLTDEMIQFGVAATPFVRLDKRPQPIDRSEQILPLQPARVVTRRNVTGVAAIQHPALHWTVIIDGAPTVPAIVEPASPLAVASFDFDYLGGQRRKGPQDVVAGQLSLPQGEQAAGGDQTLVDQVPVLMVQAGPAFLAAYAATLTLTGMVVAHPSPVGLKTALFLFKSSDIQYDQHSSRIIQWVLRPMVLIRRTVCRRSSMIR
jgi:hypothetical protein